MIETNIKNTQRVNVEKTQTLLDFLTYLKGLYYFTLDHTWETNVEGRTRIFLVLGSYRLSPLLVFLFFLVMRTLRIYPLNNFHIEDTAVLYLVTFVMLNITFLLLLLLSHFSRV